MRIASRIGTLYEHSLQIIRLTLESTFEIDGTSYHIIPNENNGADTLHGGPNGWDWRNWTVSAYKSDSITFSLIDPDGEQGFPGQVVSYVTYSVTTLTWHMKMVAFARTKKTPIMLSSHVSNPYPCSVIISH